MIAIDSDATRTLLFGPGDGWSLEPIGTWLLTEGRRLSDPIALVAALMKRLDAAGAQVDRIRVGSETLHPQLIAWSVLWNRKVGARVETVENGLQTTEAYIGSPMQFVREENRPFRRRLDSPVSDEEHMVLHDMQATGMTDYVALPLLLGSGTVVSMTLATAAPAGFSDADVARFAALSNLIAPLIEIIAMRRTTLGLLDTFVGPRISERILRGQVKRGDGDRVDAAFWYSDLRGFTALSESLPTAQLLHLLNDYFEYCAAAAAARGGEILQFIGDAILIVFEIRDPEHKAAVCDCALDAAIDAFDSIAVVNHRRRKAGLPVIEFGLGLHLGTVTHANVGSPNRLAFNVVGPAVNMTARIQAMTKETGVHLLLSADFARLIERPLRSVGKHDLRGVARAQELFTLAD